MGLGSSDERLGVLVLHGDVLLDGATSTSHRRPCLAHLSLTRQGFVEIETISRALCSSGYALCRNKWSLRIFCRQTAET